MWKNNSTVDGSKRYVPTVPHTLVSRVESYKFITAVLATK